MKYFHSNTEYLPTLQFFLTGMVLAGFIDLFVHPVLWGYYAGGFLLSYLVYFLTGCVGVTTTFHRFLSHKAFEYRWGWMVYPCCILGALGGTGSPIGWTWMHRRHHRFSDTPDDPHSPVHHGLGVLFGSYVGKFNKFEVRDLITSHFHRFVHEYYYLILLAWACLLGALGGFYLLFFGMIVPMTIQIWVSNISNYFNHSGTTGTRPYETGDNSHNVPWLSWITWGEGGGHNYHHYHPWSWKFSNQWWKDPSSVVIQVLAKP